MENISEDYSKIKDYLYEAHMQVTAGSEFNSLVKLKNVDPELRETLILLHSNYKAEFQAIKNHNFRVLLSVVDTQSAAFNKIVSSQKSTSIAINLLADEKKSKFKTRLMILALIALVGTFMVSMLYLITTDKEAGKILIELIKLISSRL